MPMSPQVYEQQRNSLLRLLESIVRKSQESPDFDEFEQGQSIKKEIADGLGKTIEKLKRNSFEIVLAGEFQGGKSTTFNTICDRRKISPMGQGIKTSATKISAMSIPENEEEYAEITWKTEQDLLLTIKDFIDNYLMVNPDIDRRLFYSEDNPNDFRNDLTLQDQQIFDIAKASIDCEWEIYNDNPMRYDPDGEGRLDLLQISTLILKHYQDSELAAQRKQKRISVDALQSMVVFPEDWLVRWGAAGKDTEFQLSEVLFVFLGYACCYIHSRNLERLGCIITDCPGLFAGPWDTQIAQTAMENADAILYLLGGSRALTNGDIKALKRIIVNQQQHKLFFAINAQRSKAELAQPAGIRQTDLASIQNIGIRQLQEDDIYIFHSRLAFNALYPTLNDREQEKLGGVVSADLANFLGLSLVRENHRARLNEIMNNQEEMARESEFPALVDQIERSIISKKAESILVHNGTGVASAVLKKLQADLRSLEDAAKGDADDIAGQLAQAIRQLEMFQADVRQWVDNTLKSPEKAELLADNYIREVLVNNSAEMADKISEEIKDLFLHSASIIEIIGDRLRNIGRTEEEEKSKLAQEVEIRTMRALKKIIVPATSGWLSNVIQGNNSAYNQLYIGEIDRFQTNIRRRWAENYDPNQYLNGLELDCTDWNPSIPGAPVGFGDNALVNANPALNKVLAARIGTTVQGPVAGVAVIFVLSCILFTLIPAIVLLPPILVLIPFIAIAAGFSARVKAVLDNRIGGLIDRHIRRQLGTELNEYFNKPKVNNMLKEDIKNELVGDCIVAELQKCIEASLQKQKDALQSRIEDIEKMLDEAQEELQRIAAVCQRIREEQIEPASTSISQFHLDLAPYFGKEQ